MEILLHRNELLDLGDNLYGVRIICQAGRCWLTQAGDNRDHILRSGQGFSVKMRGQLVVTATEDCRLMLASEPASVKLNSPWRQLSRNS